MGIDFEWKKVVFALAISLLFVPLVYLGINTFFPENPDNDCYRSLLPLNCRDAEDVSACEQANLENQNEMDDCWDEYDALNKKYDGNKYIVLMIICVITSFVMLMNLDKSVKYGLFMGVVITAFSGTMQYIESRSLIGFILMIILFVVIIYFVQRNSKR